MFAQPCNNLSCPRRAIPSPYLLHGLSFHLYKGLCTQASGRSGHPPAAPSSLPGRRSLRASAVAGACPRSPHSQTPAACTNKYCCSGSHSGGKGMPLALRGNLQEAACPSCSSQLLARREQARGVTTFRNFRKQNTALNACYGVYAPCHLCVSKNFALVLPGRLSTSS